MCSQYIAHTLATEKKNRNNFERYKAELNIDIQGVG